MHAIIKPHHFLDYMYEMAAYNGQINPVMANGSDYGYFGTLIAAGKIDSVSFTTGADDPCSNCRNLLDGICQDQFITPEAITFNKGFTRKYDYNMKMDTDLVAALPEVFSLDKERSIDEIYIMLQKKLTPEIILLNWDRENRVELTFRGIEMAIQARQP